MNGPNRYRTLEGNAGEAAGADWLGYIEGVDPVTGLPVLIYDFEGEPLASPADLESENVPRILWSGSDAGRGRIVAALSPAWQRLGEDSGPLSVEQLLDFSRALRDATAAGVLHGDLKPQRLLMVQGRLQVEGYGVPRTPSAGRYLAPEIKNEPTAAGDVYALAKSVEALGHAARDETVAAVLEQCAATDPQDRPSPEELYMALEALAAQVGEASDAVPGHREHRSRGKTGASIPGSEPRSPDEPGTSQRPGDEPRSPQLNGTSALDGRELRSAEPKSTPNRGADHRSPDSEVTPPAARGNEPGRVTTPSVPPREPAWQAEEPRERRVSLTLLGALMAAVIILALLALYGPRGLEPSPPTPLEDVVYVVEVEVVPSDLPPVAIHVVEAPEGSNYSRSDVIGTAPRHLALDRPGTWAFQGSLQDRRSEVVEIEVPEERNVTLVLPEAEAR